jgi:hypothetical protein
MTNHFALVVEWQLPDDAEPHAEDTLHAVLDQIRPTLDKIRIDVPTVIDRVTAYVDVSAELIGEAARTGQVVSQAARLHLETGDRVIVTARPDQVDDLPDFAEQARGAFPDHKVIMVWGDTTVRTEPAGEAASS